MASIPRGGWVALMLVAATANAEERPANVEQSSPSTSTANHRVMHAVRVATAPQIDGRLDDPAWQLGEAHHGFVQRTPVEGAAPAEDTEVRLVYDDRALYVSFRCFDHEANTIEPRLGRRDEIPASDWVSIAIDPYFDRKSGFLFQINSYGVVADASISEGADDDFAWDSAWDGEVHVGDTEWSAELRIPFSALRFPNKTVQTWGVHVKRFHNRTQQVSEWNLIGSDTSAYVGSFESLEGISGVAPGLNLSLLPYGLAGVMPSYSVDNTARRRGYQLDAGLDAKYALTGQLTLDATLNPDFGQVEVDPSVINLSAIETFYAEKRSFFTEGAELFRTPLLLLHTRRIGAPPPPGLIAPNQELVSEDTLAPIYGATKVTGRVASGTSIGILSALVGPGTARVREATQEQDYEASPLTHFGAVRVRQQIDGPSAVGALVTMVQRFTGDRALASTPSGDRYVGALDLDLRGGPYSAVGQVAASSGTCDPARSERGRPCVPVGGTFTAGRTAGERLRLYTVGTFLAPDFDYNAAGYMPSGDIYKLDSTVTWRTPKPWGPALSNEQSLNVYYGRNQAGYRTTLGIVHAASWKWKNLWDTDYEIGVDLPRYDPLETRGGIPFFRPSAPYGILTVGTNASLPFSDKIVALLAKEKEGYELHLSTALTILAGSRLQLQLGVGYRGMFNRERWIETVSVNDTDHYIFNNITYHGLDTTLSATGTLLKGLTTQLYGQLLHGAGSYPMDGYRELTDPHTLSPIAFPYTGSANFTYTSLLGNLVLRWEYRPLSTLYLVWTHAASFDAGTVPGSIQLPGRFDLHGALSDLSRVSPSDVVMLKLSYLYAL